LYFVGLEIVSGFAINEFDGLLFAERCTLLDFGSLVNLLLVIDDENYQISSNLKNSCLRMILCLLREGFFAIDLCENFDSMALCLIAGNFLLFCSYWKLNFLRLLICWNYQCLLILGEIVDFVFFRKMTGYDLLMIQLLITHGSLIS